MNNTSPITNQEIEADRHEAIRNFGNVAFAPKRCFVTELFEIAKELARKYPFANITFGCIGNIWHGPYNDDRAWYVFTSLPVQGAFDGRTAKFGGQGTEQIESFYHDMKNGQFDAWLARILNRQPDACARGWVGMRQD